MSMPKGFKHSTETLKRMSLGHIGKSHILSPEARRKISLRNKISMIGKRNALGFKHTEDAKNKISLAMKKRKVTWGNKISLSKMGHSFSLETRAKMSRNRRGRIPWNKRGVTPIYDLVRKSYKSAEWRQRIFIRDDFTCQRCNLKKSGELRAHHFKSFLTLLNESFEMLPLLSQYDAAIFYSPLWDIDNGITVCEACHKDIHKEIGRQRKIKNNINSR